MEFWPSHRADVYAYAVTGGSAGALPVANPFEAFGGAIDTTPINFNVGSYAGILPSTSYFFPLPMVENGVTHLPNSERFRQIKEAELMADLDELTRMQGQRQCGRMFLALLKDPGWLPGTSSGVGGPCFHAYAPVTPRGMEVAHELQHGLGRRHAGQSCSGDAERWDPDDGSYQGIGMAMRAPTPRIVAPFAPPAPGELPTGIALDLMSECRMPFSLRWISPRGWNELVRRFSVTTPQTNLPGIGRALVRAAATSRVVRVWASDAGDTLRITKLAPMPDRGERAPGSSPYVVEVRGADGGVLASAPMTMSDLPDSDSVALTASIDVPDGATRLVVRHGDRLVEQAISSAAPRLRLTASPSAGERITTGAIKIAWTARDPDQRGEQLSIRLEYSSDAGRHWTTLLVGPADRGRAELPRMLLRGSTQARARLTVHDGLNAMTVMTPVFRVDPVPPQVTITEPARTVTIKADNSVYLAGTAVAPGGGQVAARRLVWFDGTRRLGTGASIQPSGLKPGTHRIALRVTAGGRTGSDAVKVRVVAVKPQFGHLLPPPSIGRNARSLKLEIASTVPATLVAGGKRFAVTTRTRKVTVPVTRGRPGPFKLDLVLRAGRLATKRQIVLSRT